MYGSAHNGPCRPEMRTRTEVSMRVVTDRQGIRWTCSEQYSTGLGDRLEGKASPATPHAMVRCDSERGIVNFELSTDWESLSESELVEQIELAMSGADDDQEEE